MKRVFKKPKPRVGFCWLCQRKLWGNSYTEMEWEGFLRIFHVTCAKGLLKDPNFVPIKDAPIPEFPSIFIREEDE